MRGRIKKVLLLLSFAAAFVCPAAAETLGQRLARQTDFVPQGTPLDQLIEVGRRFRIPLGVEWLEEEGAPAPAPLSFRGGSVGQLIESIVRRSPGHQLSIGGRVVHVYSVAAYSHPFNFLNLRIGRVALENESLLGAEAALRHAINETLYPELYRGGWAGGYGCGCPPEFWERDITFSGSGLTIRDVLDAIVERSGKFLWVARLDREELGGDRPKWEGVPRDASGHSPLNTRWRFILLGEERPE